jgi:hypothetical protein
MAKEIKIAENDYLRLKQCLAEANDILQRIDQINKVKPLDKLTRDKLTELKYEEKLNKLITKKKN